MQFDLHGLSVREMLRQCARRAFRPDEELADMRAVK